MKRTLFVHSICCVDAAWLMSLLRVQPRESRLHSEVWPEPPRTSSEQHRHQPALDHDIRLRILISANDLVPRMPPDEASTNHAAHSHWSAFSFLFHAFQTLQHVHSFPLIYSHHAVDCRDSESITAYRPLYICPSLHSCRCISPTVYCVPTVVYTQLWIHRWK